MINQKQLNNMSAVIELNTLAQPAAATATQDNPYFCLTRIVFDNQEMGDVNQTNYQAKENSKKTC